MQKVALFVASLAAVALLLLPSAIVRGQAEREPARGAGGESVFLDTDSAAVKKLEAARDFINGAQWTDAVELLRQIGEQHPDKLVAVAPGRYVNVLTYCGMLHSRLPSEGLKVYRARIDPQARQWYEAAVRDNSEELLQRIVQQAFASSYGDQALLLLGDRAWERGDLSQSRAYWQKLLPATSQEKSASPSLNYPDTRFDPPLIRARMALATLLQGNVRRGREEIAEFARSSPEAEGRLAGRNGRLLETLQGVLREVEKTTFPRDETGGATFAGSPKRSRVLPHSVDVGAVQWSVPLKEASLPREVASQIEADRDIFGAIRQFTRPSTRTLGPRAGYFPVIFKEIVLACDDLSVFAWNLRTGKPAWPGTDSNSAAIYTLPLERRHHAPINRPVAGLPWFTLTVDRGRAYARLGSVSLKGSDGSDDGSRPRNTGSFLVSLDVDHGEGKLAWILDAAHLDTATPVGDVGGAAGAGAEPGGPWAFDGTPVAAGDRIYVGLRRSNPRPQINVVCLDAANGRLIWNRKVCAGLEMLGGEVEEIGHQLLTLADGRLYCNTNLGAIAALETRDGRLRWVATYPHVDPENIDDFNRRQKFGPNPCLFHEGMIAVAPNDSDALFAYDAETGRILWERKLRGAPRVLLGVADRKLIVSGDRLFALNFESGSIAWRLEANDPELTGAGRGALAGDLVYWPTREEIFLVEQSTGLLRRRVSLQEPIQHDSGNLVIGDGYLLVASKNRLVARCEYGRLIRQFRDEISRQPHAALPYYLLATAEEATEKFSDAIVHFRQARLLALPDEQWETRRLQDLARDRLFRLLIAQGNHSLSVKQFASAAGLFAEAASLPVENSLRLQAHLSWAETQERNGKAPDAVVVLQKILDEPSLSAQRISRPSNGTVRQWTAASWGEHEIDRLILTHGRTVYKSQEATAQALLTQTATQRDFAALRRALQQYPNSDTAPRYWLQLGRELRDRKEFAAATIAFQASLTRPNAVDEQRLGLLELARLAESRRFFLSAANWWKQLEEKFPQAEITDEGKVVSVSTLVADRLRRPEYAAEGDVSTTNSSNGWWQREWDLPFNDTSRCIIPEGQPPGSEWKTLLLVGAGVECVDSRTGKIRWKLATDDRPTWATFGGDLLVLGSSQELLAVEPESGKVAWRHPWNAATNVPDIRSSHRRRTPSRFQTVSDRRTRQSVFVTQRKLRNTSTEFVFRPSIEPSPLMIGLCDYRCVGERILCMVGDRYLEAVDFRDGTTDWNFRPSAGVLQPFWSSDPRRVTLQTSGPDRLLVLETATGYQTAAIAGWDAPWQAPPVALPDGRLACVTAPLRLQLFDPQQGRFVWEYQGGVSQAHDSPAWLVHGQSLFLIKDGITMSRVDPEKGTDLWSTRLASVPVPDASQSLCLDSQRAYLAADGALRACNLHNGKLDWEQYIGSNNDRWQILDLGQSLALYPRQHTETGGVLVCQKDDGSFLQRLQISRLGASLRGQVARGEPVLVGDQGIMGLRRE
jgi:outer membrane protein assembly factor BamB